MFRKNNVDLLIINHPSQMHHPANSHCAHSLFWEYYVCTVVVFCIYKIQIGYFHPINNSCQ